MGGSTQACEARRGEAPGAFAANVCGGGRSVWLQQRRCVKTRRKPMFGKFFTSN